MNIYKVLVLPTVITIIVTGVVILSYRQTVDERIESDQRDSLTAAIDYRIKADKEIAAAIKYEKETAVKTKSNAANMAAYNTRIEDLETNYLKTLNSLNEQDTTNTASKNSDD